MPVNAQDVMCRYHYDPLDRLVGTTPTDDDGLQRFYCRNRVSTEIQGVVKRSIFQQGEQILAQKKQDDLAETSLLATDQMRSVLQIVKDNCPIPFAYSPYGYRQVGSGLLSLLGFTGEQPDPITGHYFLGNGYRGFNPVLLRFNSPDNLSPFGAGGLNQYVYCSGDPVNKFDASGHAGVFKALGVFFGLSKKGKIFRNLEVDKLGSEINRFDRVQAQIPEKLIRRIKTADDLNYLQPGEYGKFVFTSDKKLVVGKVRADLLDMANPKTYGFIAAISHSVLTRNQKAVNVISAGYITRMPGGMVTIDNTSGHFRPDYGSLLAVKKYIEKNKISTVSQLIRSDL